MKSGVTNLGNFARQMAVLVAAGVFALHMNAWAGTSSPAANSANDQLLVLQGLGNLIPSPGGAGSPYGYGPHGTPYPSLEVAQLWPNNVTYTHSPGQWMIPHLKPDLRLSLEYMNRFTFNLKARNRRGKQVAIPDGWYELDMAVLLPDINDPTLQQATGRGRLDPYERFVTAQTVAIEFSGGTATRDIGLTFDNLSALTIANMMYISLTPLQADCKVKAPGIKHRKGPAMVTRPCIQTDANGMPDTGRSTFLPDLRFKPFLLTMDFVPIAPSGVASASPDSAPASPNPQVDKTLATYITKARAKRAQLDAQSPAHAMNAPTFAKLNHLNYLSIHDPYLQQASDRFHAQGRPQVPVSNYLAQLLNQQALGTINLGRGYEPLWVALCSALALDNQTLIRQLNQPSTGIMLSPVSFVNTQAMISECSQHPDIAFRLSLVDHVLRFDASPSRTLLQAMDPNRLTLSRNFMVSRSHSIDSAYSFNVTEPIFKLTDLFGLPLRALGLSHSVSADDGRSQNQSASGSLGATLDFNLLTLSIPATRWQRCLEVRPIARTDWPFFDPATNGNRGFYICGDISTQPVQMGEVYAHTFINMGTSSFIMPNSPLAQRINLAMRGDRDISTFLELTRQSMSPDSRINFFPWQMMDGARNYFNNTPSMMPGLIVHPVEYAFEAQPSYTSMVFGVYHEDFSLQR